MMDKKSVDNKGNAAGENKLKFDPARLKFGQNGLIPAVVQDWQSGEVLMVAYMNREALEKTLTTGKAWFWSRSRQQLWLKGETSGHFQVVKEIKTDCDYDTLLLKVEQQGAGACHEGYRSCFHNPVLSSDEVGEEPAFDPEQVYRHEPAQIIEDLYQVIKERQSKPTEDSYTCYLFREGLDKILKKVGEEAAEVIIAAKNEEREPLIYEVGDLVYHLLVLLAERGVKPAEIYRELTSRRK